MDANNEEIHQRKPNTSNTNETQPINKEIKNEDQKKAVPKVIRKSHIQQNYNIEKDPKYRCLFIILKVIIAILSIISLLIIFFNWIAPLLVSNDDKLLYLRERLIDNLCTDGVCNDNELKAIDKILEKARNAE